jgi:hypothetical protein
MGRKNRMKSTFLNEVRIGTFWLCHNEVKIFSIPESIILPKNDIVMVVGIRDSVMNIKHVQYYSQKLSRQLECTMENFYFNYRKL